MRENLGSHPDPLDLVKADVISPTVIELRCPRAGVVRHGGGVLERASILQVGGNSCCPEAVIADPRADASGDRPPLYHDVGIGLGQGGAAELPSASANRPEEPSFRIRANPGPIEISVEVDLERVVTGHLVPLAAFLPQAHPEAPVLHEDVLHAHAKRRADPRKAEDHEPDQRPVAQPDRRVDVDAVEQLAGFSRIKHRGLSRAHAVGRAADGGGRVERHDLAGDKPVKEVSEGGQAQLGCRRRMLAGLLLNPGGDVQRLHIDDRRDAVAGAPREEVGNRATIGAPRVRVADCRREELEEADAGALTCCAHQCR